MDDEISDRITNDPDLAKLVKLLQVHPWDARTFATEKPDRLRSAGDGEVAMFWQAVLRGIEQLVLAPDPDEAMN